MYCRRPQYDKELDISMIQCDTPLILMVIYKGSDLYCCSCVHIHFIHCINIFMQYIYAGILFMY